MKSYYQDEYVTLYHGDCREVVPALGTFDLRVTKYDGPIGGLAVTVMEANSRNAGKADGQI